MHECRNTIGSYVCSCHNGYILHDNGLDCKEGGCKYEITAPYGQIYRFVLIHSKSFSVVYQIVHLFLARITLIIIPGRRTACGISPQHQAIEFDCISRHSKWNRIKNVLMII